MDSRALGVWFRVALGFRVSEERVLARDVRENRVWAGDLVRHRLSVRVRAAVVLYFVVRALLWAKLVEHRRRDLLA